MAAPDAQAAQMPFIKNLASSGPFPLHSHPITPITNQDLNTFQTATSAPDP